MYNALYFTIIFEHYATVQQHYTTLFHVIVL